MKDNWTLGNWGRNDFEKTIQLKGETVAILNCSRFDRLSQAQEFQGEMLCAIKNFHLMKDTIRKNHETMMEIYSSINNGTFDKTKAQQLLRDAMSEIVFTELEINNP